MRIIRSSSAPAIRRLAERGAASRARVCADAARIVGDVRARGDRALRVWMRRLDGVDPPFEVPRRELDAGWTRTPREVRTAIRTARRHIERVAARQVPRPFVVAVSDGVRIEQRVRPLSRAGCYVPGGRFPLPSTLLMTAVPAKVAGVAEIVVACPRPDDTVLCAAVEAGVSTVLRIGGAQAIAALAYGTESIPRVDKIAGPGNAWVAAAKSIVAADCPIDLDAGPSEIVILASRGRPDWIAADLIAQAEHDPDARAILVTTSERLAEQVAAAVAARVSRRDPAWPALTRNGRVVIAPDRAGAIAIVNALAPEHLVCEAGDVDACHTAGTIYVGPWSVPALGDYCTGSNHVLPTGGAARSRGGLSAADFVRTYTVQRLTRRGARGLARPAIALARAEGLEGHAASIDARIA
jgi:histidinol dehydrogenase